MVTCPQCGKKTLLIKKERIPPDSNKPKKISKEINQ